MAAVAEVGRLVSRRAWMVVASVVTLLAVLAGGGSEAAAQTAPTIGITGHGYGHGRGMGQYGALGYSLNAGWDWTQILDHYYGGTTASTLDTSAQHIGV